MDVQDATGEPSRDTSVARGDQGDIGRGHTY